jgi:hypothetical protein
MYSDTGNTTSLVLGFPIRTSSDPRSVGSSPRHIAASHVLHRPLMPRHPPCALKHLQQKHKNQKTIQRKLHHNKPTPHPTRKAHPHEESRPTRRTHAGLMLATTIQESNTTPHHQAGQQHASHPTQGPGNHGPVVSGPNSVLGRINRNPAPTRGLPRIAAFVVMCTRTAPTTGVGPSHESFETPNPHRRGRTRNTWCSLERR